MQPLKAGVCESARLGGRVVVEDGGGFHLAALRAARSARPSGRWQETGSRLPASENCPEIARPGGLALLRMELRADDIVASRPRQRTRRHNRVVASVSLGIGMAGSHRNARNRRARPSVQPGKQRMGLAETTTRSSPYAGFSGQGSAGVIRTTSPSIQPSPGWSPNSRPTSPESACRRRCPGTARRAPARPRAAPRPCRERTFSPRHAIGESAHAGQHDALGLGGDDPGSAVTTISWPVPRSAAARASAFSAERRLPEP